MKTGRHKKSVHKQAGEALKPGEMYYRLLFEHSADAILLTAPDGSIYYANPAACRMLQRTEAEICSLGRNGVIDLTDPRLPAALEERERTGRFKGELTCLRSDGQKFPCELSSVIFTDQDGQLRTSVIIHDLTEHKKLEEELRESQRFTISTINALTAHVAVLDEKGIIIAVNHSWRKFAEDNPPVFVNVNEGANYLSVCDMAQGEDSEMAAMFAAGIRSVISGKREMFSLDYPCHSPDKKRWFTGRAARFSGPGPIRVVVAHEDITERKLTEIKLLESGEKYRNIFNDAILGIYQTTPEGRILSANPALARMYGYDRPEELINNIVDLETQSYVNPEDRKTFKGILSREGVVEKFETQICKKNGETFWVSINAHIVKDEQGNITHYEGTIEDITEHKRAEEVLAKSEALLREAQAAAHIGHWELDTSTMTTTWSEEIFHIFSLDPEEGEPSFEAHQKVIHTDDWDILNNAMTTTIVEGTPFDIVFRILRPDKTIRWMHAIGYPKKDSEGRIVSVFGTAQDITDRRLIEEALREKEEHYRILTEKNIAGIYLIQDGLFKYVNPIFCSLYGYTRDELVDKLCLMDLVVEEEREFLKDKILQRLSGEQKSDQFSIRIRRKDGEIRFLEIFCSYVVYAGKPAVLGTCIDVTEARRANEAIKRSREELRALSAYLQNVREEEGMRIAREIHDELGQSLTGIKIDISWLKKKLADIVKPADPIQAKIDSLLTLTESTIATTRELSLSLRPGILDDLGPVTAINWQLKRFQEKTGIICMLQSDVAEATIPADYSTVLFRISQECLTNISRYADATKVKITFTGEGESLVLEIEDNGKGITTEQIRNPLSLGILGMRERIMSLNGRFSIKGTPKKGTKVRVELPIK